MIKTGIVSNFSSRTFGLVFSRYQAEATYRGDGFLATTRDLIALEPTTVFKTGESEPRRPVMTWPAE